MNQFTAIYNGNGELINNIKYYDGFMGQRVGAISCLAFHPHWVCILFWDFGICISQLKVVLDEGKAQTSPARRGAASAQFSEGSLSLLSSPSPSLLILQPVSGATSADVPAAEPFLPVGQLGTDPITLGLPPGVALSLATEILQGEFAWSWVERCSLSLPACQMLCAYLFRASVLADSRLTRVSPGLLLHCCLCKVVGRPNAVQQKNCQKKKKKRKLKSLQADKVWDKTE